MTINSAYPGNVNSTQSPRTKAATEQSRIVRRQNRNERYAELLRADGWTCVPPEGASA